jgi:uncharacterized protein
MQDQFSFEWDQDKAASNLRKHGILFEVGAKVFLDDARTTILDDRIDYGELRQIAYGYVDNRLYSVVFTEDFSRNVIRIISARKANARERKRYGHREIHH